MSSSSRGPVILDTGVFAARLTPSGRLLASRYRPLIEGRPVVISFVTVAELEYGAKLAGWGPERLQRLAYEIGRTEVVWPGPHVTRYTPRCAHGACGQGTVSARSTMKRIAGSRRRRCGSAFRSSHTTGSSLT